METEEAQQVDGSQRQHFEWWHHSHPAFRGHRRLLRRDALRHRPPGALALFALLFDRDTSEQLLFPLVLLALALPIVMLISARRGGSLCSCSSACWSPRSSSAVAAWSLLHGRRLTRLAR